MRLLRANVQGFQRFSYVPVTYKGPGSFDTAQVNLTSTAVVTICHHHWLTSMKSCKATSVV